MGRLGDRRGHRRQQHGHGRAQRDHHLGSADFLEVTYPHITFRSTQIDRLGLHRYRVAGDATMRYEKRRLSFEMEASPAITNRVWSGTARHIDAIFFCFFEPSGHPIELWTGGMNFAPDWTPLKWDPKTPGSNSSCGVAGARDLFHVR